MLVCAIFEAARFKGGTDRRICLLAGIASSFVVSGGGSAGGVEGTKIGEDYDDANVMGGQKVFDSYPSK